MEHEVSYERMKEKAHEALKNHFRPEFLNRIDDTIVFHELSKPEITEKILKLGFTLKVRDPVAFKPYHTQEIATWKQIIADAGVKPE